MSEKIIHRLTGKKILLLGFGREGKSTYRFIEQFLDNPQIGLADINPDTFGDFDTPMASQVYSGKGYLKKTGDYDLVIKSPGVRISEDLRKEHRHIRFTSQTELFLEAYGKQTIGITGTKGKSTTSSMVNHILNECGKKSALIGNIGVPPFDMLLSHEEYEYVVFELSSLQLDDTGFSPHVGVILNLYPEHLDIYPTLESYYLSKWRMAANQSDDDVLVYNHDIDYLREKVYQEGLNRSYLSFAAQDQEHINACTEQNRLLIRLPGSGQYEADTGKLSSLNGRHNKLNAMAAILAVSGAGIDPGQCVQALSSFKSLPHRLEYLGKFKGIHFYNDSIATIPEATEFAIESLPGIDTLILGGFDRGLDFSRLISRILEINIPNIILTGPSGARIQKELILREFPNRIFFVKELGEAFNIIVEYTGPGKICLLSPAAASYDQFRDFSERGEFFRKKAEAL
jgi:UDP-N-acetylmuramoylalanine--D-glutamate ligase